MTRTDPDTSPGRRVTAVMALACGAGVATVYFPQAITPLIAAGLHVPPASATLVATLAQLGYAAGIFLLVPLGDRLPPRALITVLLAVTSAALLAAGLSPSLEVLDAASVAAGAATVVPQLLLPMAAGLAGPSRRGAVTGILQAGLIGGVLLARAFGGVTGSWLGWRAPYLTAAALDALLAVVLAAALPTTPPASRDRYPALLAETARLLRTEPGLRRSALYQATLFGGFSAVWTTLALLITGRTYHLGTGTVGILALISAVSVFCAPAAGRWVDRHGPDRVNLLCILTAAAAAAVLWPGALGGTAGLAVLVAGLLLLDLAVQCNQVANQARIFALRPQARSRLNTAYMTCSFLGGTLGSLAGTRIFAHVGWPGTCGLLAAAAALAIAVHALAAHRAASETIPGSSHATERTPS